MTIKEEFEKAYQEKYYNKLRQYMPTFDSMIQNHWEVAEWAAKWAIAECIKIV